MLTEALGSSLKIVFLSSICGPLVSIKELRKLGVSFHTRKHLSWQVRVINLSSCVPLGRPLVIKVSV